MEEELSKTGGGKEIIGRAKDRMDEKTAEIGEAAMGKGEIPEDGITELVDWPEESREDASYLADDGRLAETPEGEELSRKETKRRRDLDDSGRDLRGPMRKPSRSS
jgi:hypothetical protein